MHKKEKNKRTIIILSSIILSIIIATIFIKKNFNIPSYGIKDGMMYVNNIITRIFGNKDYYKLEKENEKLKEELEQYKDYKSLNEELNNEILKLKETLSIEELISDREYAFGTVINRNFDYWQEKLIINIGKNKEIENNMAVISNGNLIGITDDVSLNSSSVILLSNHKFPLNISVKIKIDDNYIYGILNNYNETTGTYEIIGVVDNIDIPQGSKVYTSGLSSTFPSGILIGNVEDVTTDNFDLSKVINVKSETNFDDISYVTVVKKGNKW